MLYWLRLAEGIDLKRAILMFRALHSQAPSYLGSLSRVADLTGHRPLNSSSSGQLQVSSFYLSTFDRRSFPVDSSIIWNSLPEDFRSSPSMIVFRQQLKVRLLRTLCSKSDIKNIHRIP